MSESVEVVSLPNCDFECNDFASYDFKTKFGPWANGCNRHWIENRAFPTLGTGKGQRLVKKEN